MFILSPRSRSRLKGVDSRLIEIIELALKISVVDFGIPEDGGKRTAERQHELYINKRSKADGLINLSKHQSGKAFDFYAIIHQEASWQHDHLAIVACALLQAASILGYPVNWGGLWSTSAVVNGIPYGWDMGHIELAEDK